MELVLRNLDLQKGNLLRDSLQAAVTILEEGEVGEDTLQQVNFLKVVCDQIDAMLAVPPELPITLEQFKEWVGLEEFDTIGFSFNNNVHPDHNGVEIDLRFYKDNEYLNQHWNYNLDDKLGQLLWDNIKRYEVSGEDLYRCFAGEVLDYFKISGIQLVDITNARNPWENTDGAHPISSGYEFHVGYGIDH